MMSDLHAKIMNLECNEPDLNRTSVAPAYRLGHRDARHAAAELAATTADRISALEAALVKAKSDALSEIALHFDKVCIEYDRMELSSAAELIRQYAAREATR